MKILLTSLLFTSLVLSDTYIKNSVITNSIIGGNFSSSTGESSSLISKNIVLNKHFTKISINLAGNIRIEKSQKSQLKLTLDEKILDKLSFKVYDDTLYLDRIANINTRLPIDIVLYVNSFKELSVHSTARLNIRGFDLSSLSLFTFGTSKVTFISGSIRDLFLDSRGTSKINLKDIYVKNVVIKAKGTSKIEINLDGSLNVDLSGISKVKYRGNPKIKKSIRNLAKLIKIR
jgi:hypothetical protein